MSFQPTKTTDDIKKLQSEMQQARNQQFLLGTGALTAVGLSSWLLPRPEKPEGTPIEWEGCVMTTALPRPEKPEGTPITWHPAAASIALLVLLWLMLRWTRTLWEVITIMSRYLELRGASEWEGDFQEFTDQRNKTFRYRSQSRAVSLIYLLLGVLVPANYFFVSLLSGGTPLSRPDYAVIGCSVLYLLIAVWHVFGKRRHEAIERRWLEVLQRRHPLPTPQPE